MTVETPSARRPRGLGALLLVALAVPALALTLYDAARLLPPAQWWSALLSPDLAVPAELLLRHSFAPRVAVSILAGAALGLSGLVMQQALRNPLADPTTLGTAAGSSLALTAATLYAPFLVEGGREWVALAGAALATLLTFALVAGRTFAPVTLILAGLVVSLVAGSAAATLMALKSDYVTELFIWQSGSLLQNGDAAAWRLAWQLALAALPVLLLLRPLALLGLGDEAGVSLGLSPGRTRLAAVVVAVALSAFVTASAGVVAFVGLAAPAVARLCGTGRFGDRLLLSTAFGALLLWLADRCTALLSGESDLPTGSLTALVGAPLILLLLPLVRRGIAGAERVVAPRRAAGPTTLAALAASLLALLALALLFGRGVEGWSWLRPADFAGILPLRLPRVAAAAAAGALLSVGGVLLQRMTGDPMASPELLGVSGGATLGVLALMLLSPGDLAPAAIVPASSLGAAAATAGVMALGMRSRLTSERLLLTGFFVATLASSLAGLVLAGSDPRTQWLQLWLSGSTYRATGLEASVAVLSVPVLMILAALASRWLLVLPLGEAAARSLGLDVLVARGVVVVLAAAATSVATLVIGPLSFVGLMAPHMARLLGFRRPVGQTLAAALVGAQMLLVADWLGRTVIFPWQVPAGLLAALMGAPFFVWLLRGRH